jgi:hypothetical protein
MKRSVEEERASIHTALDRMYEGHDELSELLDDLLRAQAYALAAKIQARSDEARAQEWGRNSGKRAYLTGMEIARKLITPKEPT